jgi:hypothetical protein
VFTETHRVYLSKTALRLFFVETIVGADTQTAIARAVIIQQPTMAENT